MYLDTRMGSEITAFFQYSQKSCCKIVNMGVLAFEQMMGFWCLKTGFSIARAYDYIWIVCRRQCLSDSSGPMQHLLDRRLSAPIILMLRSLWAAISQKNDCCSYETRICHPLTPSPPPEGLGVSYASNSDLLAFRDIYNEVGWPEWHLCYQSLQLGKKIYCILDFDNIRGIQFILSLPKRTLPESILSIAIKRLRSSTNAVSQSLSANHEHWHFCWQLAMEPWAPEF